MFIGKTKRFTSLFLALVMAFGLAVTGEAPVNAATGGGNTENLSILLSKEQLEAYKKVDRSLRLSGLIGFAGEYELDDSNDKVSVIVEFVNQPPLLQQAEAAVQGLSSFSMRDATSSAESDHLNFRAEMNALFGYSPSGASASPGRSAAPYEITTEYTDAINGVAVTLPSNMVEEMAELGMVWAVYPNMEIQAEPVTMTTVDFDSEVTGMYKSRMMLGIEKLHGDNITGKGITVGVIDSGVDYNHPDLKDAFGTTKKEGSTLVAMPNGKYYGRNFVDSSGFEPSFYQNADNDPMETTYQVWYDSAYRATMPWHQFVTSHGTHVAGTVLGRGVSGPNATLGIAPEATLIAYRALGPGGSGYTEWTLSALDYVYADGCDVVNMSLGVDLNDPSFVTSIAVNNLILQHDIVFAISAGNAGPAPSTLGAPSTSSLAITVANGTLPADELTMDLAGFSYPNKVGGGWTFVDAAPMKLIVSDGETFFDGENGIVIINPPVVSPTAFEISDADEEEPVDTEEEPDATNEPVDTEEEPDGSEEPTDTEEPDATNEPVDTEEPDATEEPVDTEDAGEAEVSDSSEGIASVQTLASLFDTGDYRIVPLESLEEDSTGCAFIELVDGSGRPLSSFILGRGYEDEFKAKKDLIEGSIVLVNRGAPFVETAKLAKNYGAIAVLVLDYTDGFGPDGQTQKPEFADTGSQYAPLFFLSNDIPEFGLGFGAGWANINARVAQVFPFNGYFEAGFENLIESQLPPLVYDGEGASSRGPVGSTLDIKPDIVAPGVNILSTVPYYMMGDNVEGNNKTDPNAEGAYDNALGSMTGTSMSSPHIAGIAALMLQYSREKDLGKGGNQGWSAIEIKARLMNTSDPIDGIYSVFEAGAGYVNPIAAIEAEAYVTVEYTDVYLPQGDSISPERGISEVASFNFRALKNGNERDQSVTLPATVRNSGSSEKIFNISYISNYGGFTAAYQSGLIADENMWNSSGIDLTFSSDTVKVPAGGSQGFDATITLPAGATEIGFFEGFVILTNDADDSEVYRLPFALATRPEKDINLLFLTHPAITTKGLEWLIETDPESGEEYLAGVGFDPHTVHTEPSFYSTVYYSLTETAYQMRFYVAPGDIDDYTDSSKWIGQTGTPLNLWGSAPGVVYKEVFCIEPIYLKYTDDTHEYATAEFFEPGHYKIIAYIISPYGTTMYPMDLIVDNENPELTVNGLTNTGANSGEYVFSSPSREETTLTGNIYDEGLAYLEDNGINYEIYEPTDIHGPDPDQALNAIFASVRGSNNWIQADIQPNGDFELNLTGLSLTGETVIDLYYMDHFAIADYDGINGMTMMPDFDPNYQCLANVYGYPFAFYGNNKGYKEITLRHAGPSLSMNKTEATLLKGKTVQLTPTLATGARDAGYRQDFVWTSSDERVATVDANGLVTAVNWGTAVITAMTTSALQGAGTVAASCEVTVTGLGDGVNIPTFSQIWFGTYEYANYGAWNVWQLDNPYFDKEIDPYQVHDGTWRNHTKIPMMWDYKGEETQNGAGDRMITLYSSYAIDTMEYDDAGAVPYEDSKVNEFLNGEFIETAFSEAEQNAIPLFTVTNGVYDKDGNLIKEYEIKNQRAYLPWGISTGAVGSKFANSVFWTAGNEQKLDFTQKGASNWKNRKRMRNIEYLLWTSYYLRTPSWENDEVLVAGGYAGTVNSTDDWSYYGVGFDWWPSEFGPMPSQFETGISVAPIIKLDKDSIIYTHQINDDGGAGFSAASGYLYVQIGEYPSFKLTVLGGNNGADVGTLSDLGSQTREITEGARVELSNVTATKTNASKANSAYRIAYKVVGDRDGERVTFKYDELSITESAQNISIDTSALGVGDYIVYVYLLDLNKGILNTNLRNLDGLGSFEAGVVQSFPVSVYSGEATGYTVEYRADNAEGELLYDYEARASIGEKVTADTMSFPGYFEAEGQIKDITLKADGNKIIVVYDREYIVEYRVNTDDGMLLKTYSSGAALGESVTARSLATIGYVEFKEQNRSLTIGESENKLVILCRVPVTINLNNSSLSLAVGEVSRLTASAIPSDADISSLTWTSSNELVATVNSEGVVTAVSQGLAVITVTTTVGGFTAVCAVTVLDTPVPPGTGNGSGTGTGTGNGSGTGTNPNTDEPKEPVDYIPATEVELDEDGNLSSTVNLEQVKSVVEQLKGNPNAVVTIKVESASDVSIDDVREVRIAVPEQAAEIIASSGSKGLSIETPISMVSFDSKAIETIMSADHGDITLTVTVVNKSDLTLSNSELAKIGDRPVYNFVVTKGETEVSSFKGGKATISVPYTLKAGENPNAIVVYYIDADGKLKTMRGRYDEITGSVTVVTTHFSMYAVGYNPVTFTDVPNNYSYKAAIDFIAAREISLGIGNGLFGGENEITRGMFLVMLMRAYGITPDTQWTDNFDDAYDFYAGYLAAAKRMGLTNGTGDNKYEQDKAISREEMFVLVYNTLKVLNEVPMAIPDVKQASDFADYTNVSPWAKEAITSLVKSKTIVGDGINIMPNSKSTRSQMAQVIYNLMTK